MSFPLRGGCITAVQTICRGIKPLPQSFTPSCLTRRHTSGLDFRPVWLQSIHVDPDSIIAQIANEADDLLAGAGNRKEARADLAELLDADHPKLSPADRKKVIEGVIAILDKEGFFEAEPGGD
jgi:hypothetical protein